jgi:hypothetical protein
MSREDLALGVVAPRREVLTYARALGDVPRVERPDGVDRGELLLGENVGRGRSLTDDVLGVEAVLEAYPIEILPMAEDLLPLAMGPLQLGVDAEYLLGSLMEAQVHRATTQMLREVFILRLAFLPAGRDNRDAAVDTQLRDRLTERWVEALRS